MSFRRVRDDLKAIRQVVHARGGRRILIVGSKEEAAELRRRLPANATVIIVNTGIVRR